MAARFLYWSEAAPRRSLKWKVTYRIGVHTIPDRFSRRHENLSIQYSVNIALTL